MSKELFEAPETKRPDDCTTCTHREHPENCRKFCPTLRKNNNQRVKKPTPSNI